MRQVSLVTLIDFLMCPQKHHLEELNMAILKSYVHGGWGEGSGLGVCQLESSLAYIKTVRNQSRINKQTNKMVWRVLLLKYLKGIWLALRVRRD